MILMEMMLEVVIGVLVMEVDKLADEVTNMDVDKVTNMMAEFATDMELDKLAHMKILIEDLTEVILEILVFQ